MVPNSAQQGTLALLPALSSCWEFGSPQHAVCIQKATSPHIAACWMLRRGLRGEVSNTYLIYTVYSKVETVLVAGWG